MPEPMIKVQLGDFVFKNMEVPSKIPLGGSQLLAIQKLVGGTRIIDSMGPDPIPMEWGGWFLGSAALERAKYLDRMRILGKPVKLTWSELNFTVIIDTFVYDFERIYKIPYRIKLEVVTDDNNPITTLKDTPSYDTVINDDKSSIDESVNALIEVDLPTPNVSYKVDKFASLKASWTTLKGHINSVKSFAKATTDQMHNIKQGILDVQGQVTQELAGVNSTLQAVTTLGGVFPNNTIAQSTRNMMRVAQNANNQVQLMNIQYLLMKTSKNVSQINPSPSGSVTAKVQTGIVLPTTESVRSANLYTLAAKYYKNAMKWTLIAKENGLSSPFVSSPMTLTIPKDGDSTGGNL